MAYREKPPEETAKDTELALLRNDRWWQVYCAALTGVLAKYGPNPEGRDDGSWEHNWAKHFADNATKPVPKAKK